MALFHFSNRGTGRAAEPDTISLDSTTTGASLAQMGSSHAQNISLPPLYLTLTIRELGYTGALVWGGDFKTGFLAVLEFTIRTRLTLNSHLPASASPVLALKACSTVTWLRLPSVFMQM